MNFKRFNSVLSENLVAFSKNKVLVDKARLLLQTLPDSNTEIQENFKINLQILVSLYEDKRSLSLQILSNASDGVMSLKINGSRYEFKLSQPMEPVEYAKLKKLADKSPKAALNRVKTNATEYRSDKTKEWKKIEQKVTEDNGIIPTAQSQTANNGITLPNNSSIGTSRPTTPVSNNGQSPNSPLKPGTLQVQKNNQVKVINAADLATYQQQGWQILGQIAEEVADNYLKTSHNKDEWKQKSRKVRSTHKRYDRYVTSCLERSKTPISVEEFFKKRIEPVKEMSGATCAGGIASVATPLGSPIKRRKNKTITVKENNIPQALRELFQEFNIINEDVSSYDSLEDVYPPGDSKIYYVKSEFLRDMGEGFDWLEQHGKLPNIDDLGSQYVLVGTVQESDLEKIYSMMQGDIWSPAGEAKVMINALGCGHTSMSVGDIIETKGTFYFLDSHGFKKLGSGSNNADK